MLEEMSTTYEKSESKLASALMQELWRRAKLWARAEDGVG